jgi:hypothetical protein
MNYLRIYDRYGALFLEIIILLMANDLLVEA